MSYNIQAITVDSKKIKSVWGSRNEVFLSKFMKKNKKYFKESAEDFDIDKSVYEECMRDIINGELRKELVEFHFIYGYLYELLCLKFGKYVKHECFLSFLFEVTDNRYKAFIPIPKGSDWPEFYSIEYDNLEEGREMFLNNKEPHAKEEYYIDAVNMIFNKALKKKKDLVFIGY